MARALVVDDEQNLRLTLSEFLKDAGHEVEAAEDAASALALLQKQDFDVVLSDIILPRGTGVELLKRVRATAPRVQVILMTGEPTVDTGAEAVRAGAFDYLFKPVAGNAVVRAVNGAAQLKVVEDEKRRLEAENRRYQEELEQLVAERTEELRTSQAYLSNALRIAKLGHWEYDVAGDLFTFSDECYALFRTSAEQMGGYTMPSARYAELFVHPDDVSVVATETQKAIETTDPNFSRQLEHRMIYADGESGHIAVRFFIEKDSEGRTVRTFGVNQDITGQKRAETELRQTNTLLREAFQEPETSQRNLVQQERLRAFGEMASGVAHDFNNALSPILGYSELLLLSPETLEDREKAKGQIWIINTAARDAANVVRRLREFYRTREGDELFLPVDLNGLVEQAVDLAQPRWKDEAQSRGLDIAVETDLADVPLVSGIEPELREVLINLLFNGVDALKPEGGGKAHGALTVRTRAEDEHVAVEVSDTGAGMTPAVRERCLDPFFTTKGERGTGLGLSMVHGIVKRHGGTIAIDSELGRGTTFVLRFPVDTPTEAATVSLLDTAPARLLRVLVVDDERAVRDLVKEFLLADGHSVETAANGRAALEKFAPGAFDLVITDRAMPEMGGDELAAALKELAPTQPILMLTGFGDRMAVREEKPAGVDRVLGKPPTLAVFRAAVARLTEPEAGD